MSKKNEAKKAPKKEVTNPAIQPEVFNPDTPKVYKSYSQMVNSFKTRIMEATANELKIKWELGGQVKLLLDGTKVYGEKQAYNLAEELGISESTLYGYKNLYIMYPLEIIDKCMTAGIGYRVLYQLTVKDLPQTKRLELSEGLINGEITIKDINDILENLRKSKTKKTASETSQSSETEEVEEVKPTANLDETSEDEDGDYEDDSEESESDGVEHKEKTRLEDPVTSACAAFKTAVAGINSEAAKFDKTLDLVDGLIDMLDVIAEQDLDKAEKCMLTLSNVMSNLKSLTSKITIKCSAMKKVAL